MPRSRAAERERPARAGSRSRGGDRTRRRSRPDCAMGEPGAEQLLQHRRQLVESDIAGILARHRLLGGRGGAAADIDVIALDALLAPRDLAGQQADVADIVLGARMMAAGEMDVDRQVDRDARLEIVGEPQRMALGVGGGELAAGIAGAGDQAAADRARLDAEAQRLDRGDADADIARRRRRRPAGSARP